MPASDHKAPAGVTIGGTSLGVSNIQNASIDLLQ